MRYTMLALATFVLLAGCSSHKVTVSNGGTTVTTSGDNQTVTVQGKEGTVVAGKGAVDTAKLGLPIYPGANASGNAGWSTQTKEGAGAVAILKTADSFDKVYAWYRQRMPAGSERIRSIMSGAAMAAFQVGKDGDADQKTVTLTSDSVGTSIMLVSKSKSR